MAGWFLDSSAVVKRYVLETGTRWIRGLLDPAAGHDVLLAAITGVEVVAAVTRRKSGGGISVQDAAQILAAFRHDFTNQYLILELTPAVLARAMALAQKHGLRGYDAVQLAAALEDDAQRLAAGIDPATFVSADQPLNAAAQAEGLMVDDPNAHP
jgi:predicted nucleic acid-binding protein